MSGHVPYAAFMRVALVRASVVLVAIGASSCTSSPKDAESSEVVGSATDPTGYETNSPASVMTSSDAGATDRETHNPATSSNPAATSRAGAESGDVPTSNQADDVGTARDRGTVKDFTGVEATSGERGETSSEASYASGTPSDDSASSLDDSSEGNAKPEPRPLANYLPCDIERIIASRCRICHGAVGNANPPLLESWSDVRNEAELIVEVVAEDYMPLLPPPLTREQKASLQTWVASGAEPMRQADPPSCL